jgi:hypothetical protein
VNCRFVGAKELDLLSVVLGWLPVWSRRTVPLFLKQETFKMKRIAAAVLSLGLISIGLVGCDEKKTTKMDTKTDTTVTTPTGTKTTTHEVEVKDTIKENKEKTP